LIKIGNGQSEIGNVAATGSIKIESDTGKSLDSQLKQVLLEVFL